MILFVFCWEEKKRSYVGMCVTSANWIVGGGLVVLGQDKTIIQHIREENRPCGFLSSLMFWLDEFFLNTTSYTI